MDLSEAAELRAPRLVWSPHILMPARDRELVYAEFYPRESIAQYLARHGLARRFGLTDRRKVLCTIDGARVPRPLWPHVRPKAGTLIELRAIAGDDGGGGKNPLATVAMIALMVYAPQAAAFLAPAGATATTVLGFQAGIMVAGSMAINAVFPPPRPHLSQAQSPGPAESPTYSLTGGSNRARPFMPMPKICGRHRFFPDLGAKPYTEFEGEDQVLYQVFDCGYNDIVASDFRIGTTPLGNYAGVTLQESGPDGKLTLFPGNVDTQAGAALVIGNDFKVRVTSPGSTAIAVDIVGELYAVNHASGQLTGQGATLELVYKAVGAAAWLPLSGAITTVGIGNATRKPVRLTYRKDVAAGQYEVGVRVVSASGIHPDYDPGNTHVCELAWSQLRSYQPDTADYTGRKRFALKITASGQLNGMVEQLNFIAAARTLTWNGAAWVTAETSNPSYWVLDAFRGTSVSGRRVFGGGIGDARLDLEGFKAFAAWCQSKNLTFDGVFDQQLSVREMAAAIALCGFGTLTSATGKHGVVWDAPDQPVSAVFTMSNIKLDTFEIEYATGDLADEIVLSFINQELDWQRDTVRAVVPGVASPIKSRNVELIGCAYKAMAGKFVNRYAAANKYRVRRYKWQMDWDGMPVSRGDVGRLSHDLAAYDHSMRLIEGSTANALKLPKKVPLQAGGGWVLVVKPDASVFSHQVAGGAGETDTLNLVNPLPFDPGADPDGLPVYDYRVLYGLTANLGKKVKIDSWKPVSYDTVEITAIDEGPEYYAAEGNLYGYTPPRPVIGTPAISDLALTEEPVRAATGYLIELTATWTPGSDYGVAEIRVSVDGGPLVLFGETRGRSYSFRVNDQSTVLVEVTVYSSLGRLGNLAKASLQKTVDFASKFPPADVTGFGFTAGAFTANEQPDVDFAGFKIRFHYGTRDTWQDANDLHAGLLRALPYAPPTLPADVLTVLIKAFDAAGRESQNAAAIRIDTRTFLPSGDELTANVLATLDLKAQGWPGTITGGAIVGGNIEASNTAAFYSGNDSAPFYTGDQGASFYASPTTYTTVTYQTSDISMSSALAGSELAIDALLAGSPVFLEWRQSGPGAFYRGYDGAPFYSGDPNAPFYEGPGKFKPWLGKTRIQGEPYQFRLRAGQGETKGVFSGLTLTIDAPDLVQAVNDFVIAAGGARVPLTLPFTAIKNVRTQQLQDAGTAVRITVEDKDAALGPLLKGWNSAGVSVQAKADATIQGY